VTDADRLRELEAANSDADQMIESISNELGEIIELQKAELAARDAELARVREALDRCIEEQSQKVMHERGIGVAEMYQFAKGVLEGLEEANQALSGNEPTGGKDDD